jgi:hypothetical protein
MILVLVFQLQKEIDKKNWYIISISFHGNKAKEDLGIHNGTYL